MTVYTKLFTPSLPNIIQVPFKAHESYYLSEKSGKKIHGHDFAGKYVAEELKARIAKSLMAMALVPLSKAVSDCTWFISKDDWNEAGWNRLKALYGFNSNLDSSIKVQGGQSFVVETDAAELVLHEWTCMPWSGGACPVVVYGFTEFSEFTTGVSSLYYELRILNPSGIHLL